jgi:hypothetical protein
MERTIKIWLSIIFPGLLGFVASCLVILPQLTMRGLGAPWDIVVGVFLAGAFSVLFSRMLAVTSTRTMSLRKSPRPPPRRPRPSPSPCAEVRRRAYGRRSVAHPFAFRWRLTG